MLARLSKTPRLSSTRALSLTTIASKGFGAQIPIKTCRSELARDAFENAAFTQHTRVIVNDHGEQAHA
ncbi:hypothetical protein TU78_07405 [Pseudomonas taetrolens]|uniref:Uncharacterized protein n=1 Tax=Pseudomonas taetrolens TaxID=47884 RepID=A0A0J6GKJ3_PSETA|nr:hypothetical protein TU78_07405 [Pseudomonas taetrolens]